MIRIKTGLVTPLEALLIAHVVECHINGGNPPLPVVHSTARFVTRMCNSVEPDTSIFFWRTGENVLITDILNTKTPRVC